MLELTGGGFAAVVSMSEVLWVFYDGDPAHPDGYRVQSNIQSTGTNDPMVNVMKRAGRVLLTTHHCSWTW